MQIVQAIPITIQRIGTNEGMQAIPGIKVMPIISFAVVDNEGLVVVVLNHLREARHLLLSARGALIPSLSLILRFGKVPENRCKPCSYSVSPL
jgi:hypothetical protein